MDADRMFSALAQDFKDSLPALELLRFVCFFIAQKIISWSWFSSCNNMLCFNQSVIVD